MRGDVKNESAAIANEITIAIMSLLIWSFLLFFDIQIFSYMLILISSIIEKRVLCDNKIMKKKDTTKKKKSKLKILIAISISSFLFIISVCLILLSTILTDKTKYSHQNSGNEISEIIKKNYLKSFKNTGNSGVFSFSMDETDINDLFDKKSEQINNKYVSKMYYQTSDNHHYFCIELKRTFIVKSRIVFDTIPTSINDDFSYNLGIVSCKMGKANALPILMKKKLLKEDIFENEYLPIKYNSDTNSFVVSPLKLIEYFPKSEISNLFFDVGKDHMNLFSLNGSLFGFNLDFSKLVTNNMQPEIDYHTEYHLKDDIKTACESVDFSGLSVDESFIAYSLSEETLTNLFTRSIPASKKETLSSSLTEDVANFELSSISVSIKDENLIGTVLYYSLNGYVVDVHSEIVLTDDSSTFYNAYLESKAKVKIGEYIYEGNTSKKVNKITNDISEIFVKLSENHGDFFNFNDFNQSLEINLETMNNSFTDLDLKYSQKSIIVNSTNKRLDFVVTKSA